MSGPDIEVDARGLLCPLPIVKLAKAFRQMAPGSVALLIATDPAAVQDVNAFCRETGHTLVAADREGEVLRFRVRKG